LAKNPAYPLYAADFEMDTAELDIEHIGLYFRLLNVEWLNGSLPKDTESLARIARVDHNRFITLWDSVKVKFYENGDGRLYNKRMEEERKKRNEFKLNKSNAGKIGMNNRWGNKSITEPITEQVTNDNFSSSSSFSSSISLSTTNSNEKDKDAGAEQIAPVQSTTKPQSHILLTIFKEENKKLPDVISLSKERLKKCAARLKTEGFEDHFRKAVQLAQTSKFLLGENNTGWKASFDWFIANDTNVLKVIEGKYKDKKPDMQTTFEKTIEKYGGLHGQQ
jgi:uncharacterized protein YdaU (DUF1376 family)